MNIQPLRFAAFCFAFLLLAGCATKEPKVRALWPVPPAEPKIEFVGIFASEKDFPRTDAEKAADRFLGEGPQYTFRTPFGIVSDGQGTVYISDLHLHNVRIYDFNEQTVEFLVKNPIFQAPMDLDLDGQGNLYVADGPAQQVWVFAPDGTVLRTLGDSELFINPAFLTVDDELGRVYVADSKAHNIKVFDLESGRHLLTFGGPGEAGGEFGFPQGLAVDAEHNLYVADRLNARIQVLDSEGNFLRMFGVRGDRFDTFEAPRDLAFDAEGNLWVTDQRRSSIYTYTPDGRLLLMTGSGQRTTEPLGFAVPSAIDIDRKGRIYIADMLNKRFSVWQILNEDYLRERPITEDDLRRIQDAIRGNLEKDKK